MEQSLEKILSSIKAVVFDLDGTLTDSIGTILECTKQTFISQGFDIPSDEAIKKTIGLELSQGITTLLPEESKHLGAHVTQVYRDTFIANDEFKKDVFFKGTLELLQCLKERDIKIAYASGRSRIGVDRTIDNSFLSDYCDARISATDAPSKPNPTMMLEVLKMLKVEPKHALGVGDSDLDISMFQAANSYSVGVLSGVLDLQQMTKLKPNLILHEVGELKEYFDRI